MTRKNPKLDKLAQVKIRLYRLVTESHLAIGTGEAAADLRPVDKPVIRALIYDEKGAEPQRFPYIPASSIHGVWRSSVEKALRSDEKNEVKEAGKLLAELKADPAHSGNFELMAKCLRQDLGPEILSDKGLDLEKIPERWALYKNVCNPFWSSDCCERVLEDEGTRRETAKAKRAWFDKAGVRRPCEVCSIFGHTGERGRVRFSHAFPGLQDPASLRLDILTRNAINRQTGTSEDGKLFDLEAVPPGVAFYFFVVLENLVDPSTIKIFDYGLNTFNLNLATLGAHSSVGFGCVSLHLEGEEWTFGPEIFDFAAGRHDPVSISKNGAYSYPKNGEFGFSPRFYPRFFRLLALRDKHGEGYEPLRNIKKSHNSKRSS